MTTFDEEYAEQQAREAAERRRTGGPAFPQNDLSGYGMGPEYPMTGMSLRDYFAGQALSGMLASEANDTQPFYQPASAADRAYWMADAMLAARSAPTPES